MIRLALLLILLPDVSALRASELELKTGFLPLYVQTGVFKDGQEAVHAKPRLMSFVSRQAEPEAILSFLSRPFIPAHDESWSKKGDANLISLCGIKVTHAPKKLANGGYKLEIILDFSVFEKPKNVRLSRAEVVDLVRDAIALNFEMAAIVIRNGEQDGARRPATGPASKSEGKEKPKPESKGRSQ